MKEFSYVIFFILFIGYSNGQVVIPCNFNNTQARGYECRLPDVDLSQFDSFIIGGDTHLTGLNDGMVESFFSIHNNFQIFPTTHLARFPNLRHIKVSESLLQELPAGAVANRPTLQTLSLSANFISTISPAAFTNTVNILSLNIQFNQLRHLNNSVLQVLPNLQEFDFSFNLIERVQPETFNNNRQIITLNMNSNRLRFLNETFFTNIPALRTLFFQNNLCHSETFLGVDIPINRAKMLTRLQPCFIEGPSQFTCIFGFSFEGMQFDDYTCYLRGIEAYDYNREINLGGFHIAGQTNVDVTYVWVHLSDTRFIINEVFTEFINLRHLQISTSNLQRLQDNAFRGANNLQRITIDGNTIRRLEANSFLFAVNLREIHMWSNQLEYVHENAFLGLWNLHELKLFGGNIVRFEPSTFAPLWNLRFLEVSYNLVEVLDSRWFANNTFVQTINFNNNLIYAVGQAIVEQPALTNLQLLANICVDNVFTINDQTRDQVRQELDLCFTNYPMKLRRFWMELEGDLSLYWSNGTLVGHL